MPAAPRTLSWLLVIFLACLFAWGGWEVISAPLRTGEAYPPYSSYRADPLGAKALYESLAELPGLSVSRLYKKSAPLDSETTLLIFGENSFSLADSIRDKQDTTTDSWTDPLKETLNGYEELVKNGGRLVIAFLPTYGPERALQTSVIGDRWNLRPKFRAAPLREERSGEYPRESALYFDAGPEWRTLKADEGRSTEVERSWGRGAIVLVADSYILSNQGLAERNDSDSIATIIGGARHVVFDEYHLGVVESGSVAGLIQKYRLGGALAALLLAAGLFLWRASSSFLPPRTAVHSASIAGRDANEGMVALLRRSVPESQLVATCLAEWRRSKPSERDLRRVESSILKKAGGSAVQQYRLACLALRERT